MIKLLNSIEIIEKFTDICGVKIQSLANSYGFEHSFCSFWVQESKGEIPSAVICKFGSAVTVSETNADYNELFEFLNVIGFSELICGKGLAEKFDNLNTTDINWVEKKINPAGEIQKPATYQELLKAHNILMCSNSEAVTIGTFDDWYVDISHRIRHGGAVVISEEYGCGILLLSKEAVVINGIVVSKEYRGKGFGKKLLYLLENTEKANRIMAFCLESELQFYLKHGYKIKDNYKLISKG